MSSAVVRTVRTRLDGNLKSRREILDLLAHLPSLPVAAQQRQRENVGLHLGPRRPCHRDLYGPNRVLAISLPRNQERGHHRVIVVLTDHGQSVATYCETPYFERHEKRATIRKIGSAENIEKATTVTTRSAE